MRKFLTITLFLFSVLTHAQEKNIVSYLQDIESGNRQNALNDLPKLLKDNPNDPSVLFLDAVLTPDGETALQKYSNVYKNYPNSNYADAALYRVFSYYYALGIYNRAENILSQLKTNYPKSPYIKAADRKIPDIQESGDITASADNSAKKTVTQTDSSSEDVNSVYSYTVQAGAFLNSENAIKLRDALVYDGFAGDISTKDVGGSILNVVTAGKFVSEKDASTLLDLLKTKYQLNGRVVKLESGK